MNTSKSQSFKAGDRFSFTAHGRTYCIDKVEGSIIHFVGAKGMYKGKANIALLTNLHKVG